MTIVENLAQAWRSTLAQDYPQSSPVWSESIIKWLLGPNPERLETLELKELNIVKQSQNFIYRIFRQRYWGVSPDSGYRNLLKRLASVGILRQKIQTSVALSRDTTQTTIEVLQETLQEILQKDRYIQGQLTWIAQCTSDRRLSNALLLTKLEEYCLRPIRNQPLISYRFVNYLRRSGKAGMTQVPVDQWVRLISEEVAPKEDDDTISLYDTEALGQYVEAQTEQTRQILRQQVITEFSAYLAKEVDQLAAQWLNLYVQGYTQEAIGHKLNLPIKQIYRLRDKVTYHALRVFAVKHSPELVANWLELSLSEHNLGLTPSQWLIFWESLNPKQQQILEKMKDRQNLTAIATEMKIKPSQILKEWTTIYKKAQSLRNSLK